MFRGITAVSLDPKGRMVMPTRYRERLQEDSAGELVITIDTESPCLLLYPLPEWETIEHKLENLSSFNRTTRRIQRLLIGHATEVQLDNNGRLLLPSLLRDYAKLDKSAVLVGQGKKFELWDEATWHNSRASWLAEELARKNETLPDELQTLAL